MWSATPFQAQLSGGVAQVVFAWVEVETVDNCLPQYHANRIRQFTSPAVDRVTANNHPVVKLIEAADHA
jgi:hypothetical protein